MIPGKRYTPELVLSVAWRRKWLIVIPAVIVAALGCGVTYGLPNMYRAETTMMVVPPRVPETYVRSPVSTKLEDRLRSISQQVRSRTRLERIIEEFNLFPERRKTDIMQDIVDDMSNGIDVDIVQGDVFKIAFTTDNPRTAQLVTERLGSFFVDESLKDRTALAENASHFLEEQATQTTQKLRDIEQKLTEYRRKHDGELPTQVDGNRQALMTAQIQLQTVVSQLDRDREAQLDLRRRIADLAMAAEAALAAPVSIQEAPQSKAAQLAAARGDLQLLAKRYKPGFPVYDRAAARVVTLEKEAAEEAGSQTTSNPQPVVNAAATRRLKDLEDARTELERLGRQIDSRNNQQRQLNSQINDLQRKMLLAPIRDGELVELTREYGILQSSYSQLASKKLESQVSADLERGQSGEQFRVLDPARLPERPSSPNRQQLYIITILVAVAVGLGAAAAAEYLDRGLRSEDDVRLVLALPVLATIPVIGRTKKMSLRRKLVAGSAATILTLAIGAAWFALR